MSAPAERLAALLEAFKIAEPAQTPAWLETDRDALAVARAWAAMPAEVRAPLFLGQPPMHRRNRWKYVWQFRNVPIDRLAAESGVPAEAAQGAFERLKGAFLLYPDGTLSRPLAALLSPPARSS